MDSRNTNDTHAESTNVAVVEGATPIATEQPRTLTIREAAEVCGITRTAMRGRVERGSVQSVLRHGVRRIPIAELERAGLLHHDGVEAGATGVAAVGAFHANVSGMAEVLAMLERLQSENKELVARAVAAETRLQLEQQTASSLQLEYHEVRARATQLEEQLQARREDELEVQPSRRRWFGIARRR